MSKSEKSTELVKFNASSLMGGQVDEEFLAQHAGEGHENIRAKDMLRPQFKVLQGLSNELKPESPAYDENARAGQIYITTYRKTFKANVLVVVCHSQVAYYENEAGAKKITPIVRIHNELEGEALRKKATWVDKEGLILPNGNKLSEHHLFQLLVIDEEAQEVYPCQYRASGTAVKFTAKALLTDIRTCTLKGIEVPVYAQLYSASVGRETKGSDTWYRLDFKRMGLLTDKEIINQAQKIHEFSKKGEQDNISSMEAEAREYEKQTTVVEQNTANTVTIDNVL